MNILFVSSACSENKYKDIFDSRNIKKLDPSQKFFKLIIDGMVQQNDINITCLTELPVSRSTISRRIFKKEKEIVNERLTYVYMGFINGKILRYLTIYCSSFFNTLKWIIENRKKQKILICDSLKLMSTHPARILCKFYGIPKCAFVTDIPTMTTSMKVKKSTLRSVFEGWFELCAERDCKKYDGYILVADAINEKINLKNKPYIVIEGSVPKKGIEQKESMKKQKYVLYTGGLFESFGVVTLANAFHKTKFENIELHFYGEGTSVKHILSISKIDKRIRYMGIISTEEIVKKQEQALLLVNPRPTNQEFVKYSFPSKTLEYMASGTPVLTTKLPSIPKEYSQYLFWFQGYNEESLLNDLNKVLSFSDAILMNKGRCAKEFVLEGKNNFVQAKKIIHFIEQLTPMQKVKL